MTSRIADYLERLPSGIDSYAAHCQKAAVYRTFLERLPTPLDPRPLPAAVQDLVRSPPPPSTWIPTVHTTVLYLAVREQCFLTDGAYLQQWLDANRAVLSSSVYRFLMMVASPSQVVRGAVRRWNQIHRGISMRCALEHHRAIARLTFPQHLLEPFQTRTLATAFQASLELSGASEVVCELREYEPTLAVFEARWR